MKHTLQSVFDQYITHAKHSDVYRIQKMEILGNKHSVIINREFKQFYFSTQMQLVNIDGVFQFKVEHEIIPKDKSVKFLNTFKKNDTINLYPDDSEKYTSAEIRDYMNRIYFMFMIRKNKMLKSQH